jgi:hypothetical protein
MATHATTDGTQPVDMIMKSKPVCGGDEQVGEYDVGIHVLGLCASSVLYYSPLATWLTIGIVLVLAFSIFGMQTPTFVW